MHQEIVSTTPLPPLRTRAICLGTRAGGMPSHNKPMSVLPTPQAQEPTFTDAVLGMP